MRAFFALPLPEAPRRRLAALETDLGKARWVPIEQLHLTLRFLGEVDDEAIARVLEAVEAEQADAPLGPLRFALRGLGTFGGRRPRVLFAAIDPVAPVAGLAARLERAVRVAGLPPEPRTFRAHVTLARFRAPRPDRIASWLRTQAAFATEPFDVAGPTLYRSHLTHRGAVHEIVRRFGC